jgi:hypothetical protein
MIILIKERIKNKESPSLNHNTILNIIPIATKPIRIGHKLGATKYH